MNVQIITIKGKPTLAVLPIAEYERLLELAEDRADASDAQRVAQRISAGEEETLPAEFVAKLAARKERPLRSWRKYRGLTLAALGEACGVTRSALSQIESGRTHASGALLRRLASALGCDMDDLV